MLIYENVNILTMDPNRPRADAVAVEGNRIAAVGRDARGLSGTHVDLKGNTLLPAFIDAHSHITALARTAGLVDLRKACSNEEIVDLLRRFKNRNGLGEDAWIVGFGYDHNRLAGRRHPDRHILDGVGGNPVLISNVSGHMGVANSAALNKLGVKRDTPEPQGGKIGREESGEPSGYLEESAFFQTTSAMPEPDLSAQLAGLRQAEQEYLRHGVATIQDGLTGEGDYRLLERAAQSDLLRADVVCYLDWRSARQAADCSRQYRGKVRVGGWKIILDGSPQGRTAYLTRPYAGEEEYRGYPVYSDDAVSEAVAEATDRGVQLLAHCNGDAAADQFLGAVDRVRGCQKLRPVMIHAQTVRVDQVRRMATLGVIPSFFVAHTYYWGDTHLNNLGMERAQFISPAAAAERAGIAYTFHQDTPVLPPDMLDTVWCAVNRVSREGADMGICERVTPEQALAAVTRSAAYQYFEEGEKGRIAAGLAADFAVLDGDPTACSPQTIKDIGVLATVKGGKAVYQI